MKATVYYVAEVSVAVEVEIPDDIPEDERIDAARETADAEWKTPEGLCWNCSHDYEIGEFEQSASFYGVTIHAA